VQFPFDFSPEARCDRWLKFLDEVLEGDQERIAVLQEFSGYILTPDTSQQKMLLTEGDGANGKSVCLDTLTQLLGTDNVSHIPLEIFGQRFQLTPTLGKLANICSEIGEVGAVAEGILKQFTSGDRMYFDRKGIPGVEAYPTARLILATNNRPRFADRSSGIWRRLIVVPFRVTIPAEKQDRGLQKKLQQELPGIFLWAMEGLRRLRAQGGFTTSQVCEQALAEYRKESNPAQTFLQECCELKPEAFTVFAHVYSAYRDWCLVCGFPAVDSRVFGKELQKVYPQIERKKKTIGDQRPSGILGLVLSDDRSAS
jgi:P4 family phage/plasmid primase-like protien